MCLKFQTSNSGVVGDLLSQHHLATRIHLDGDLAGVDPVYGAGVGFDEHACMMFLREDNLGKRRNKQYE